MQPWSLLLRKIKELFKNQSGLFIVYLLNINCVTTHTGGEILQEQRLIMFQLGNFLILKLGLLLKCLSFRDGL